MSDVAVLIGGPDAVVPGSVSYPCAECAASVSVAPSGQDVLRENPAARVLCIECGMKLVSRGLEIKPISPAQIAEIARNLRNYPG